MNLKININDQNTFFFSLDESSSEKKRRKERYFHICVIYYNIAKNIWFQVSGTPGKHQCIQSALFGSAFSSSVSTLPPVSVYTEEWPSILYSEIWVMLMIWIGTFIFFTTLATTLIMFLSDPLPQYFFFLTGFVSLKHFTPSLLPQSALLKTNWEVEFCYCIVRIMSFLNASIHLYI